MKIRTTNKQQVHEVPWGVYLWQMPNGSFVSDGEHNFLMVASTEGNQSRMDAMRNAVKEFGITEGKPYFMSGVRPVTEEEYEEQKARLKWGLTPDPLDVAAINEDRKHVSRRRK